MKKLLEQKQKIKKMKIEDINKNRWKRMNKGIKVKIRVREEEINDMIKYQISISKEIINRRRR